jgi:ornithine cyclodeaminase
MRIRILSKDDLQSTISMRDAIAAVRRAFGQLSAGRAQVPVRSRVETGHGVALFMPAYLEESRELAVKVVSVFGANPTLGLPTISAMVVVLDAKTGQPKALLDGAWLTALRTGAASGVATDLLAARDAASVAVFGAGVQARSQIEAVCAVRYIHQVRIYAPSFFKADIIAQDLGGLGSIPSDIKPVNTPADAVRDAEIVVTATTSHTPVFNNKDLAVGAHINAVGSYKPEMQELSAETVRRAKVIVDSREACLAEAGDLIIPLREGLITESHIYAELGEIVNGVKPGRESPREVTLFKSVGNAVQDAAVASLALRAAEEKGLGKVVEI